MNTTISAIALDLRYGTSKKCDYASTGVAVLRIPNIADHGRIDLRDLKSAEFDDKELAKLSLQEGDLLVIRSNGSLDLVGKTSVVTKAEAGLLFAGYLMRLRVDTAVAEPAFVQLSLSGSAQRRHIEQTAKSTSGVNNLNAEELRALRLWLPELAEQREIVSRVAALFLICSMLACWKPNSAASSPTSFSRACTQASAGAPAQPPNMGGRGAGQRAAMDSAMAASTSARSPMAGLSCSVASGRAS